MANNISYQNRKREALEWEAKYQTLLRQMGGEIRQLEHSESAPRRNSKDARETYNQIVDALNEYVVAKQPPAKAMLPPKGDASEMLAMLISDTHFGKFTEMDGQVIYNLDIASQRFKQVVNSAKHLYSKYIRGDHAIDDIHLFFNGDLVDGEQIYAGQEWNLDQPITGQLRHATRIIGDELLSWASSNFNNVVAHFVGGNHGEIRAMGEPTAFHRSSNFDLVLAMMLEAGSRNLSNVHFDIGMDPMHVMKIPRHGKGSWTYQMMHKAPANQTISGTANPIYGRFWQRTQWDVFMGSHWHNVTVGNFQGKPILHSGALFSDDEYTRGLGYGGFASQLLFTIPDKRPLGLLWPVDLEL